MSTPDCYPRPTHSGVCGGSSPFGAWLLRVQASRFAGTLRGPMRPGLKLPALSPLGHSAAASRMRPGRDLTLSVRTLALSLGGSTGSPLGLKLGKSALVAIQGLFGTLPQAIPRKLQRGRNAEWKTWIHSRRPSGENRIQLLEGASPVFFSDMAMGQKPNRTKYYL